MLDDLESLRHVFQRMFATFGDLFERDGYLASCLIDCEKVAVFVEISDDRMACKPDVVGDSGKTKLPFEVIRQRLRLR